MSLKLDFLFMLSQSRIFLKYKVTKSAPISSMFITLCMVIQLAAIFHGNYSALA